MTAEAIARARCRIAGGDVITERDEARAVAVTAPHAARAHDQLGRHQRIQQIGNVEGGSITAYSGFLHHWRKRICIAPAAGETPLDGYVEISCVVGAGRVGVDGVEATIAAVDVSPTIADAEVAQRGAVVLQAAEHDPGVSRML